MAELPIRDLTTLTMPVHDQRRLPRSTPSVFDAYWDMATRFIDLQAECDRYREALRQIAAWMPDMDAPSAIATDALEGSRDPQ